MSTRVRAALGAALLAGAIMDAPAQTTGRELLEQCTAGIAFLERRAPNTAPANICVGYLAGFTDGYAAARAAYGHKEQRICAPTGVTMEQLARVVVNYLQENPQRLHEARLHLTFFALERAFPCS